MTHQRSGFQLTILMIFSEFRQESTSRHSEKISILLWHPSMNTSIEQVNSSGNTRGRLVYTMQVQEKKFQTNRLTEFLPHAIMRN